MGPETSQTTNFQAVSGHKSSFFKYIAMYWYSWYYWYTAAAGTTLVLLSYW